MIVGDLNQDAHSNEVFSFMCELGLCDCHKYFNGATQHERDNTHRD